MTNDEKILKALEDLRADVTGIKTDITVLRTGQQALEAGQMVLQADVKGLTDKVDTVELKVEAIHAYQKQAHDEIMGYLIDTTEIEARDKKLLEKRIERIEKHLGLPPLK
jgi:hypothetical protein